MERIEGIIFSILHARFNIALQNISCYFKQSLLQLQPYLGSLIC